MNLMILARLPSEERAFGCKLMSLLSVATCLLALELVQNDANQGNFGSRTQQELGRLTRTLARLAGSSPT